MASPIRTDRAAPGELFIWTAVDAKFEDDFNLWYDREHMAERAAIPGFRWARRYRALAGDRPYLALYRTHSVDVFTSDPYQAAFQSQTAWSLQNFERMHNTRRRVMVVSELAGAGVGGHLSLVSLGTLARAQDVAAAAVDFQAKTAGVLAVRVLWPEPQLSTPLPSEDPNQRILEPIALVDTTHEASALAAGEFFVNNLGLNQDSAVHFALLWELRSEDLTA